MNNGTPLQGEPCAYYKSGIPGVFCPLQFLFACTWASIVLLLFAVMGVRKDRILVIFAFLKGLMSVRSGEFSISEQIKYSRRSAI